MNRQDKQEFTDIIQRIKESNIQVIVEGKKDRKALNAYGINNIIELNQKPLFQIIEEVSSSNSECVILTDLDRKGKELFGKLNSGLQQKGIKINNTLRDFLFRSTKLRQIEGLASYLEGL